MFNISPYTSFSQNVGPAGVTGFRSCYVTVTAGALLMVLGLVPRVGALVESLPVAVLGGARLVMFGMVAATGVRILGGIDFGGVDFKQSRFDGMIIAISLRLGMIPLIAPDFSMWMPHAIAPLIESGILLALIPAVALNLVFKGVRAGERNEGGNALRYGDLGSRGVVLGPPGFRGTGCGASTVALPVSIIGMAPGGRQRGARPGAVRRLVSILPGSGPTALPRTWCDFTNAGNGTPETPAVFRRQHAGETSLAWVDITFDPRGDCCGERGGMVCHLLRSWDPRCERADLDLWMTSDPLTLPLLHDRAPAIVPSALPVPGAPLARGGDTAAAETRRPAMSGKSGQVGGAR